MVEIRHLENPNDVIFFLPREVRFDRILQTGAEWLRWYGPIWQTFGRIQWPIIPEPPAILLGACCHLANSMSFNGEFNVMIPQLHVTLIVVCCRRANSVACHPRATYHIAGSCHLVNSLSWFHSHMPHCRLQSAVSWRNQCHDRATLQGVIILSALLSCRSRQRERLSASMLSFVRLSVAKMQKTRFSPKLSNLVQNDMSTAVIWSKSKPDVEFQ